MTQTQTTDREGYAVLVPSHDNRAWQLNYRAGCVIYQRKVGPYSSDPNVLRDDPAVLALAAGRPIIVPTLGEKVPS